MIDTRGGFRERAGEGADAPFPPQEFDPLPTQRVPHGLFLDIHFW